jgi:hypothetical protein
MCKRSKDYGIPDLGYEVVEVACFMEMNLLSSFFDIQPHYIVHLPGELLMAGSERPRWMYFIKRYLEVLEGWIRQMARLESCMVKGYNTHEAMKIVAEYYTNLNPKWI